MEVVDIVMFKLKDLIVFSSMLKIGKVEVGRDVPISLVTSYKCLDLGKYDA